MSNQTLTEQLEAATKQFKANSPIEAQIKIGQMIEELQKSGIASGKQQGEKAVDFKLTNALGQDVILFDELAKGPVVLVFYRGGWCPFCNMQLRAYQRLLPEIHAVGAQLIAISPQKPDHSLSLQEKEGLEFQVLSDPSGLVTAKYNLLFDVPQGVRELMEGIGVDLTEYNNTSKWILPVPATFMIDESAIIRSAYVNPNFMQRQSPEEILRELKKL
ncbi:MULTISPECIES: peroxiredoxin-like family protein [unclassified Paenibacillus]|uniref:peroxiredoxin-like family protein n=1 Tax=unclassified Paenibacillus TaxID=185978 RepID=UPI00104338BE|nr:MULTISPECIES: peroxiredoxin-like family protein [unclassified Paenibacillus]NIK66951.1 peroxiredoxin [Paenibacillus sp. BK720]TCN01000.1 peroxiredoxin [Paenibacillus sp. BK033]